ncbi:metalloregulator ArsR/SmtB family transcription factor [Bacillus siamensis]|uniref:ArsR family transcriptional regulator n=1 Tax=Bacillus siamensis TaxID=659243 RepID=A0AAI8MYK3_9BACI|nr:MULTISPECIES: metalloregulator ArsR/SmtB family transcription factor [Bacillus]AME06958.1 ArsR family transcriptional regulator [Bacillus sp. SDLI1]AUJ75536.1 ArsR family transcriptional regulator [Bacillus siamensis]UUA84087.1 metalloregulator ArsR/SmtB family transcription factor [Bacillus siamensis]UZD74018.1 metalloregulator ArsR/SmtB family transcription factor [Bacillus siamensis]
MQRQHNALSSEGVSQCLKLLSDTTRLLMLKFLKEKEYCVCELTAIFGMSQPGISQHLRKLKNAGLVRERREGQWRYYAIHPSGPEYALVRSILQQIDEKDGVLQTLRQKEVTVSCR